MIFDHLYTVTWRSEQEDKQCHRFWKEKERFDLSAIFEGNIWNIDGGQWPDKSIIFHFLVSVCVYVCKSPHHLHLIFPGISENQCVCSTKRAGLSLLGWHLVIYLWIKHGAKGRVNAVSHLHQSLYRSIHPICLSIHPWALHGKTLTLLRFWSCSHM